MIPAKLVLWAVLAHGYTRGQEAPMRMFTWYTNCGAILVSAAPLLVRIATFQITFSSEEVPAGCCILAMAVYNGLILIANLGVCARPLVRASCSVRP